MQQVSGWRARWPVVVVLGGIGLWIPLAYLVVPRVIRAAYEERSLAILNGIMSGRDVHPVDRYLDAWSSIALRVNVGVVILVATAYLVVRFWGQIKASFRQTSWRPATLSKGVLVAAWFGWLTGFSSAMVRGVPRIVNASPTGPFEAELWIAPLLGSLAGIVIGLFTWFLAGRGGRQTLHPVISASLSFLLYSCLSLLALGIHPVAGLLLCVGFAVNMGRPLVTWGDGFVRLTRRSLPWMTGAAVVAGIGMSSFRTLEAAAGRRALGASPQGAKNVLLLILDTARAQNMSLYGATRTTTPNIDEIAREGTVFDFALAPSPWTLPSHASYFTGLYPQDHGANWSSQLAEDQVTLADVLAEHGYHTGGFSANRTYVARRSGLDQGFHRFRDAGLARVAALSLPVVNQPLDAVRSALGMRGNRHHKSAEGVNDEFLEWLGELDEERPFFAFLNYFDVHSPYYRTEEFKGRFVDKDARFWMGDWVDRPDITADELLELEGTYDEAFAYVDQQVANLVAELERRGQLENTLVVIASDHGELFGEHGLTDHGKSVYLPVLWVPLVLIDPAGDAPVGSRIGTRVSMVDLPATILDLARVPASLPGRSLARYWTGDSEPDPMLTQVDARLPFGKVRGVHDGNWSYMLNDEGPVREELYDLSTDWAEEHNLAIEPDSVTRDVLVRMRVLLDSLDAPQRPF